MPSETEILSQLMALEERLQQLGLWQTEAPSAEALASVEPFCVDTLNFVQWLQFVFVPKMRLLLERQIPLPSSCQIAPMAQEYFKGLGLAVDELMGVICELDLLLSA